MAWLPYPNASIIWIISDPAEVQVDTGEIFRNAFEMKSIIHVSLKVSGYKQKLDTNNFHSLLEN